MLCVFLSGCAVAPLSNHISARSNGEGGSLLSAGSTIGAGNHAWVPSIKYTVGLSERFDLGFQYEVIEWGAYGKYQLVGENAAKGGEGFALAGLVGSGLSYEGFYGFLGPVLSYKTGAFEPYFVERFNYVDFPRSKVDVSHVGEVHVDPGIYLYLQHSFGFFYWANEWLAFGAETSLFTPLKNNYILKGRERWLYSGQVSFRF